MDAYLYFYSLVTMDLTRKQLTNVEPGKGYWIIGRVKTDGPADYDAAQDTGGSEDHTIVPMERRPNPLHSSPTLMWT